MNGMICRTSIITSRVAQGAQNANSFLPLSFDSIILVCYGAKVGKNFVISEGMTYFSDC